MKSNGKIVALAVVLAALTIGVGYAAIQTINLTVNGTASATANSGNFVVEFTGTPVTDDHSVATINSSDKTKGEITVSGLTAKGDSSTTTFTISNESADLSADLVASTVTNSNSDYFKVTTSVTPGNIAAGATATMTIKVELIKTPIDEDPSTTIETKVTATPVQPQ